MKIKDLVLFIKISPIVLNLVILIELVFSLIHINICNPIYPIFGHSLFFDILLLYLAKIFKLCLWNKLLIYNLIFIILMEWMTVNVVKIDPYIYITLLISTSTITSILSTLLFYRNDYNTPTERSNT